MKVPGVVFVCRCLESGHDGVGDYARMLAVACAQAGVSVAMVGLNDPYVKGSAVREDLGFPVLRLAARTDWAENVAAAAEFVEELGFEWVSFQFVPYSYGKRGLVGGLAAKLAPLTKGRNLQVMFHEIWIGATEDAGLKDRVVGWLQRVAIRDFVREAAPKVVQTSNLAYMKLLGSIGVNASRLPLLGTIPHQETDASGWLYDRLKDLGIPITASTRSDYVLFGFFGTLHPIWPAEPLVSQLEEFAMKAKKKVVMLSFGKLGSGEGLWDCLSQEKKSASMAWCKVGLVSALEASQLMNSVDFGVAASPLSLLEKSGTAVCFMEHGLPLIVNRNDARFSGVNPEDGMSDQCLPNWKADFVPKLLHSRRFPAFLRGPAVRNEFLKSLGLKSTAAGVVPNS